MLTSRCAACQDTVPVTWRVREQRVQERVFPLESLLERGKEVAMV